MRVAVVVPGFPSEPDDPCLPYLADFVAALGGDHDLEVFAVSFPHEARTFELHGARVETFGAHTRARKLEALRGVPSAIERRHRARPFDLVHAWWAGLPGAIGVRAARRLGVPALVSVGGREVASGDLGPGPATRALVAGSLRAADRLTAGSAWLRDRLPASARERAVVLPLGVDTARFAPLGLAGPVEAPNARGGARLLFVGSLTAWKDPVVVVRALARVRRVRPDATLRIVGEGPLQGEVRRVAAEVGVADAVRLDGAVAPSAVAEAMRAADRLVCASRWESQGLVVAEALATGLPVVATAVGFAADVGPPLVRTWSAGDPDALADAIVASLGDPAHAVRVAEEGPPRIASHASTEAMRSAVGALWATLSSPPEREPRER